MKEEALKKYEEALKRAQEEYENAVGPIKREYERTERKAFTIHKEAIERARELIKDIKWDSDDKFTLKSY
ncbi:MAG: hypothetical protein M1166_02480 [Candidatus Thermoplasmatota archaeon]|nr:hypothetical protein [Candidatus Thermoplasmatota archaeon]